MLFAATAGARAGEPGWAHLSSQRGELPVPGESRQQTAALVLNMDKTGPDEFILGFRQKHPALLAYRYDSGQWKRCVVEKDFLTIEAGGASYDIDGDGDLDVVFGGDWQSKQLWWWENPNPVFQPDVSWKRRLIKNAGASQHHDQIFGDFKGIGRAQLVFWNQGAKTLFLSEIPERPKEVEVWSYVAIFSGQAGERAARYAEGLAAGDIDADGKPDLLAGNYWFKHEGGTVFRRTQISDMGGRIAVAKFKPGKYPQVVIAPGDGIGPLRWFECTGAPLDPKAWKGHDLLSRPVVHGHSLETADINGDGHMDILCAEMAKWSENKPGMDNPTAAIWLFLGNGQGEFKTVEVASSYGTHEAKLGDFDGDGDLDILDKPYTWEAPRVDLWLNPWKRAAQR